jgi:hypothetical protein
MKVKLQFEVLDVYSLTVVLEGNQPTLVNDLIQIIRRRVSEEKGRDNQEIYEEI